MNLKSIQINLLEIIKDRNASEVAERDSYIDLVSRSKNILFVRKVSTWWRKTQIESYCHLTASLLRSLGRLEDSIRDFLKRKEYSPFREEIGIQFLEYLIEQENEGLIHSLASFELSLIELKLGYAVESSSIWDIEPYAVIESLLNDDFEINRITRGTYKVIVSYRLREEHFRVEQLGF